MLDLGCTPCMFGRLPPSHRECGRGAGGCANSAFAFDAGASRCDRGGGCSCTLNKNGPPCASHRPRLGGGTAASRWVDASGDTVVGTCDGVAVDGACGGARQSNAPGG
jgi:hypothetical protein